MSPFHYHLTCFQEAYWTWPLFDRRHKPLQIHCISMCTSSRFIHCTRAGPKYGQLFVENWSRSFIHSATRQERAVIVMAKNGFYIWPPLWLLHSPFACQVQQQRSRAGWPPLFCALFSKNDLPPMRSWEIILWQVLRVWRNNDRAWSRNSAINHSFDRVC